ncbi:hypothetical protein BU16DRAFT_620117 [Lophium mytilinum]|uniref:CENP-V/GFA domain-containing protein n=1 Tax=Lophium mytilinum TaxID=390894 RepID=A0A6A6QKN3_9PEZI|nr:hypothetical protein BU16DRAFT_620117 [Lophium mytilinum]
MAASDKTQNIGSTDDEATATCFCGAVQMAFPTWGPGYMGSFLCHCLDCHKITSSMFSSGFCIDGKYIKHTRGQSDLKTVSRTESIASGNTVTNYSCSTCGTLMYRLSTGFPGLYALRIGTVDDVTLMETKLKPTVEQFTTSRVAYLKGVEGMKQVEGNSF